MLYRYIVKDLVLGIESSCDDTCACLMSFVDGHIEYNRSIHQDNIHMEYGGIVPNLASEAHLQATSILSKELKKQDLMKIACIAVTTGPGLIGSLLVGVSFAKGLAMSLGLPLLRINHLEGHALSCMIENDVKFPYLLLLVSGGNSQITLAHELGKYTIIGKTLDDAGGEALDKIAKNLGIKYPGGINMEKIALTATDKNKFHFKDGSINKQTFNFSFSGLKTQVLYKIRNLGGLENIDDIDIANLAYASQEAIFDTLINKVEQAICHYKHKDIKKVESLVVCGGVSANKRLSQKLFYIANKYNLNLIIPSIQWTTDNAGMIAKTGCMYWNTWKQENKDFNYNPFDLSFPPLAKWEIDKI